MSVCTNRGITVRSVCAGLGAVRALYSASCWWYPLTLFCRCRHQVTTSAHELLVGALIGTSHARHRQQTNVRSTLSPPAHKLLSCSVAESCSVAPCQRRFNVLRAVVERCRSEFSWTARLGAESTMVVPEGSAAGCCMGSHPATSAEHRHHCPDN